MREHPIRLKVNKDGELLEDKDDADQFFVARAGNHLMVPFQCELCHFRNVMKRDTESRNWADQEILDFMRRANLDDFWSREMAMVKANLQEAMCMERMAFCLRMPSITLPMGPFSLEDVLGTSVTLAILDRSGSILGQGCVQRHHPVRYVLAVDVGYH
jgi:hypothetical protein